MPGRAADLPAGGMIPDALAGPRRRLEAVPDDRPLRAVIYVRQSMKNEESISLELQEEICRSFCMRCGYTVVAVIPDQKTGRAWIKRKGIREVMRMVAAGEVDRVILYRWSRISRRRLHQAQAIYLIEEEAGALLESATEPFDTKTASGKFGRDQMLSFASFQSDLIGEQWAEVHDRRRGQGLPHCGGRRFAYVMDGGRYEPDPGLVEVDRWRYAAYLDGDGFEKIAVELNRRGIPNAKGRPWNSVTLANTMDSGFSAGLVAQDVLIGQRRWIPGTHQANITQDTWVEYLRLRQQRATIPPQVIEPRYPLAGLAKCGDTNCGKALLARSKSGRGVPAVPGYYYRCENTRQHASGRPVSVIRGELEKKVLRWVRRFASDIDAGAKAVDETGRARLRAQIDVDKAAREVAAIDRQLARLMVQRAGEEDIVPESAYVAARDELLAQRATAQATLDAAAHEAASIPTGIPRQVAVQLIEDWDVLPVRARRDMLAKLIRVIRVTPLDQDGEHCAVQIVPVWSTA